ncbi:MAG: helix-turn-helix domain-containing protein [Sphingobacterium sp.]|nr:helix-turn-helix domain-containing protein [Sphingobacterium sp.]
MNFVRISFQSSPPPPRPRDDLQSAPRTICPDPLPRLHARHAAAWACRCGRDGLAWASAQSPDRDQWRAVRSAMREPDPSKGGRLMSTLYDSSGVRALLLKLADQHGSQKALARHLGISPTYLCDVIKGKREAGTTVLEALGLVRVVRYAKIKEAA